MEERQLWSTSDLANEADVSSAYIRQLILDGKLPATKQGRDWVIFDEDVQAWLEKRKAK